MNTRSWMYYGDKTGSYTITLYHGPTSGNLLVVCNNRVMLIDFMIFKEKTYSFFIDDDLLEIRLIPTEDNFEYDFKINKDAKTPKNEFEKKRRKREKWQAIAFVSGFFLIVAAVIFYFQHQNHTHFTNTLHAQGLVATGRVFIDSSEAHPVRYYFTHQGNIYSGEADLQELDPVNEGFGLPIQHGQEYKVLYHPNRPSINTLLYDQPTSRQINLFIVEALETCESVQFKRVGEKCICFLEVAMKRIGDAAIPLMINQQLPAEENHRFNTVKFDQLKNDTSFQKAFSERCEESFY